ncbi:hypothetical protein Holit_00382 [Hollandina sp. SP2]
MKSAEVAKLTGYATITIMQYAGRLGVSHTGDGYRKTYDWTEADVERFLAAIQGTGGRRDRRGETQKFLKKMKKNEKNA